MSPHFDDVVGSCGGTISKIVRSADNTVTVLNLFAGKIEPPYSKIAGYAHEYFGNPPDIIRLRQAEDEAATAKLGIAVHCEDIPSLLYRKTKGGNWVLGKEEDMWKDPHPDDQELIPYLSERIQDYLKTEREESRIYAPLGIGNHVDHQLVFQGGLMLLQLKHEVIFYEDFPYVLDKKSYSNRIASLGKSWASSIITFEKQHLLMKIEAFSYYRSQIPLLFKNQKKMRAAFTKFFKKVGGAKGLYGERYWLNENCNPDIL